MSRFVALACLLAGCATAAEERTTNDAGSTLDGADSADAAVVDARPDSAPDACIAVAEACNNADEDCDGAVDEELGLGTMCDGADSDACVEGMIVCDGSGGTACADMTGDTVELCNGMDDDCRNGADDTFPVNQPCSVGLGACARAGQLMCNTAMTGTVCNAVAGPPSAELCGNITDEDCNGADAACPSNDAAAGAINISNGGTFTADLTAAHDDNWASTTGCGNQGGRDVFYTFTLGAEEVVYFDTFGSNFDTTVRIFAGACSSIGATQMCSDDTCSTQQSQGAINLLPGTYCLVVDQYSSNVTAGMASLTFRRGARPGIALPNLGGSVTGTTAGKTNLSFAGCEANTSQPDVGHFFLTCPNRTYTVAASTCTGTAFDSVIYLRSGSAATTDVACSDDSTGCGNNLQSRITGATISGANLRWVIVDGFGNSGNGNYTLTYSVQ